MGTMKRKKKMTVATGTTVKNTFPAPPPSTKKATPLDEMETTVASTTTVTSRRNAASTIERTDRFKNIDDGLIPYRHSSSIYGPNKSSVDVRDAVILCQKCYYNFALFRNIIDLMTEFSTNDIYFQGGSKQSRDFFTALFNKINLWDLQDKFFREYYRSGNVFVYRFDAEVDANEIRKIVSAFAAENPQLRVGPYPANPEEVKVDTMNVPARYILLNPADVQMMSTLDFSYGLYFKVLNDFEIARLRNPKTEEDVAVYKNLPEQVQKQIKEGSRSIAIPLDPDKVSMVFYKKQDYEPFAVPMGYPVLEDINAKAEMRKIDMAIARTMQQIVLLVTAGAEPDKGGINPKNIAALQKIFANESVGRTVIADFTTKAEFVVPTIGELLDPKKYQVIDNDINVGLNNVFAGSEKFANQAQKVELFIERLEQGRRAFLNNFLIPEIKRIAKALSFKNFPRPYFEDIKLKDNTNMSKIFARLIEIGVLTPEQGLQAIENNQLPDLETMEEAQQTYKEQRDSGLYVPLVGGPKDATDAGRPEGATAPQTVKTISPIGTKASIQEKYSLTKIKENMILANALESEVGHELKRTHKLKRLTKFHKELIAETSTLIMANEEPAKWIESVPTYVADPEDRNHGRVKQVNTIAVSHQLDNYLSSLLLASKVD
jgi:hypothetical protein